MPLDNTDDATTPVLQPKMRTMDAILLVAHGSVRYPDAGRIPAAHLTRIATAHPKRPLAFGALNGIPSVAEALASLTASHIRVVPFFMEDGYFCRVAIPRALSRTEGIVLCPPIGLHDGIAGLIAGCASQGCAATGLDPNRTALLVVGHGSARSPGRALALHRHTATVAASSNFAAVQAACLEEPPFLADALRGLRTHPTAIVGFFAGEGGHVCDDVPAAIASEQRARGAAGQPVLNFGPVTDSPALAQFILDQADAA